VAASLMVSLATLELTEPAKAVTTTLNCAPLSVSEVRGVV
jgi:hypothetical protein